MDRDRIDHETGDPGDPGDVERVLSGLAPAASVLAGDRAARDRLMYAAGERAGRRSAAPSPRTTRGLRVWQAAAVLLATSTGGLAWVVATHSVGGHSRGEPPMMADGVPGETVAPQSTTERPAIAVHDRDTILPAEEPFAADARDRASRLPATESRRMQFEDPRGFLAMRHVALTQGVDALPGAGPRGVSSANPGTTTFGSLRRGLVDDGHL